MRQLYTQLFASSYIWLLCIFEASYSTMMTSVSKILAKNQYQQIRTREIDGVSLSDVLYEWVKLYQIRFIKLSKYVGKFYFAKINRENTKTI